MARPQKPWYRKQTGWWMVEIGGKQEKLIEGPKDAFHRELAEEKLAEIRKLRRQSPHSTNARTADIIEAFLQYSRIHLAADTHRMHRYYCQVFAEYCGEVLARELKPHHITEWISQMVSEDRVKKQRKDKDRLRAEADDKSKIGGNPRVWGETTIYNAKKTAFRVFSWAADEKLLPENPLKGMKRPKPAPRQRALSEQEFWLLYNNASVQFRDFLLALYLTGARPKEVRELTWNDVHEDKWVLAEHKSKKQSGRKRVIMLSKTMCEMMERLRDSSKSDYVFLNTEGHPWSSNAVRLQIMRLKRKLKMADDVCAYLCRHGFGTRAILNGVSPSTLKELMGHSSLEMISKVYVHLADQHEHLRDAVEKVSLSMPSPDEPHPVRKMAKPVAKEEAVEQK